MNFLSDIGGIFNSVFLIGKVIVFLFIDSIVLSKIMKEIFHYTLPKITTDFELEVEKRHNKNRVNRKPRSNKSMEYTQEINNWHLN